MILNLNVKQKTPDIVQVIAERRHTDVDAVKSTINSVSSVVRTLPLLRVIKNSVILNVQ